MLLRLTSLIASQTCYQCNSGTVYWTSIKSLLKKKSYYTLLNFVQSLWNWYFPHTARITLDSSHTKCSVTRGWRPSCWTLCPWRVHIRRWYSTDTKENTGQLWTSYLKGHIWSCFFPTWTLKNVNFRGGLFLILPAPNSRLDYVSLFDAVIRGERGLFLLSTQHNHNYLVISEIIVEHSSTPLGCVPQECKDHERFVCSFYAQQLPWWLQKIDDQ